LNQRPDQYHLLAGPQFEKVPKDRPVAILLRHSIRADLSPDHVGYSLPITEEGWLLALALGEKFNARLKTLHSSPLTRCLQTASAINAGAGLDLPIIHDRLLGDPGAFVVDDQLAWSNWIKLGSEGVMRHLVSHPDALPGMRNPDEAAYCLVNHMLTVAGSRVGIHLFVSHDSLVLATAARLLAEPLTGNYYPYYLEGAIFWQSEQGLHTVYKDLESVSNSDEFNHLL
jgi:hypothetical protein